MEGFCKMGQCFAEYDGRVAGTISKQASMPTFSKAKAAWELDLWMVISKFYFINSGRSEPAWMRESTKRLE